MRPTAMLSLSGSTQIGGSGQSSSSLIVNELTLSGNTGAYQLTSGSGASGAVSTFNWITNPVLTVAAEDDTGQGLDPNEVADITARHGLSESGPRLVRRELELGRPRHERRRHRSLRHHHAFGRRRRRRARIYNPTERRLFRDRMELLHGVRSEPDQRRTSTTSPRWRSTSWPTPSAWARARTPTRSCTSTSPPEQPGDLHRLQPDADRHRRRSVHEGRHRLAHAGGDVRALSPDGHLASLDRGDRPESRLAASTVDSALAALDPEPGAASNLATTNVRYVDAAIESVVQQSYNVPLQVAQAMTDLDCQRRHESVNAQADRSHRLIAIRPSLRACPATADLPRPRRVRPLIARPS